MHDKILYHSPVCACILISGAKGSFWKMILNVANKGLTEIERAIKPKSSQHINITFVILSPDLFSDCLCKELEGAWHEQGRG